MTVYPGLRVRPIRTHRGNVDTGRLARDEWTRDQLAPRNAAQHETLFKNSGNGSIGRSPTSGVSDLVERTRRSGDHVIGTPHAAGNGPQC